MPDLTIFFGSQTGKAEALAQDFTDEAIRRGVDAECVDLDEFTPAVFEQRSVFVFLLANTGDGDFTDNALKFEKYLFLESTNTSGNTSNACAPGSKILNFPFAVFGLGDRTYLNFDQTGRKVDARLEELGARRLYRRGTGDDSGNLVGDFDMWKKDFWEALKKELGKPELTIPVSELEPAAPAGAAEDPNLFLAAKNFSQLQEEEGRPAEAVARFYFNAATVRCSRKDELRTPFHLRKSQGKDPNQSTVHVEFDISEKEELKGYSPASTFEILPMNLPKDVDAMVPIFGLTPRDLDRWVCSKRGSGPKQGLLKKHFPTPCTLREALTQYCDLRSQPCKRLLAAAMRTMEDEEVVKRLKLLLANADALKLIEDEHFGMSQLEFWPMLFHGRPDAKLDAATFLAFCPRQRSRPYTIASTPLTNPDSVAICVSLLSTANPLTDSETLLARRILARLEGDEVFSKGGGEAYLKKRQSETRFGLCSRWLCQRFGQGQEAQIQIRPSHFRYPSPEKPMIMVGAGAGVAPFYAFFQHRDKLVRGQGERPSSAALFFGCRCNDEDFLYRSELQDIFRRGNIRSGGEFWERIFVAYSRPGNGAKGEYVQDIMMREAKVITDAIADGAIVYICGSNQMGQGVLGVLASILKNGTSGATLKDLKDSGRLVQECWGEAPRGFLACRAELGVEGEVADDDEEPPKKKSRPSAFQGIPPPDEVKDLIQKRRSIFPKDYREGGTVPEAVIRELLEVARWAPSHGKMQPWRFTVFELRQIHDLIDATLKFYESRDEAFWREAWFGEFSGFPAFQEHVENQRRTKWGRCAYMISIGLRRQQPGDYKRMFPVEEEIASVACAVHNMHLLLTAHSNVGGYWSSWFEHFTSSPEGLSLLGLNQQKGDLWMGVFCVGEVLGNRDVRAYRKPIEDFASWYPDEPCPAEASNSSENGSKMSAESAKRLLENRRSILPADYTREWLPDSTIVELLVAARWAPSHGKLEPWRFKVYSQGNQWRLIDSTLDFYSKQGDDFWKTAWDGEYGGFAAFKKQMETARGAKWLKCSHMIAICLKRQRREEGKRQFPLHEELAAVACAVQNMHLMAASLRVGAYWSSWYDHFTESDEGVRMLGLEPEYGDKWLGMFCVGQPKKDLPKPHAVRKSVDEVSSWRKDSFP